ncbi:MAG: DHH family phosphoesterase [Bacteroidales bacterium]|nr:DHH family phosphoesterase [Bacteroidales bacterium]
MNIEIKNKAKEFNLLIQNNTDFIIFGHVNPDGDAIGSTLALYHYLKNRKKNPQIIMPNDFPDFLNWMPDADKILRFDNQENESKNLIKKADVLIFCDFNDLKRLSKLQETVKLHDLPKVMIDHHPQPTGFADIEFSDTSVSSTAELMFEILLEISGNDYMNRPFANCILTGIITDTGVFNHNSEQPRTYEIMAALIRLGGEKQKVINEVYNNNTHSKLQLLGNNLLNGLHYYPEFASAFIVLSIEDQEKFNYKIGDTEGHVNIPLSIKDINLSALFIEKEEYIKISLRSKDQFDVNIFARKYYHGGGHKNAAGGKSYKPLNKTIKEFVNLLEKHKNELLNG